MTLPALQDPPIAIIPARGGSKRIPRKNIADVNGKPLLSYPIAACLEAGIFSRVIVSTEDSEIAEIARDAGAEVDNRPDDLAGDRVPATMVMKELLERFGRAGMQPDSFCLVYAIAAFIEPQDLRESASSLTGYDGVLGVAQYPIHPYKALYKKDNCLQPLWPDLNAKQSQSFPDVYASNGTFCWMRTAAFLDCLSFYPSRLHGYVMPSERSVDIDTPEDLERARRLMAFNAQYRG